MDGFVIQNVLAESRATLLYTARDGTDGQTVGLKTLHPRFAEDKGEIEAFAREEWLARRVVSRHFPQYVPLAAGRRTQLYFAMSWHAGRTWQQMLGAGYHMSIPDAVRGGVQMLKGLGALHRLSVLHRDIKPANIHLDNSAELRILDLGVARERKQRFGTAEEFGLALERGEAGLLPVQRTTPYAERDPLAFWRAVGITSIVINLLLLYWISAR